jgi:S-DNA-T family DNA segregation ATPase FtsK/SpoIIIE
MRTAPRRPDKLALKEETKRHISAYVQIALSIILFLVLQGRAGMVGEAIETVLRFFFGSAGIIFPIALLLSGVFLLFRKEGHLELRSSAGLTLCLLSILGFIHVQAPFEEIGMQRDLLGGAIGFMVAFPLLAFTSLPVAYVVLSALFLIGILFTFDTSVADIVRAARSLLFGKKEEEEEGAEVGARAGTKRKSFEDLLEEGMRKGERGGKGGKEGKESEEDEEEEEETEINIVRPAFAKATAGKPASSFSKNGAPKPVPIRKNEDEIEMKDTRYEEWEFPSLDVLDPARSEVMVDDETLQAQAKRIQEKLKEFDVSVTMRDAHPGPTVTQFTLEPSEGVKLSRIGALKNDLALALAAPSLRIEAPIPGKSLVGIEMPNEKRTIVHLRELLESPEFRESESSLTLPLGRDVSGKAIVADLLQMPHLLVAGATGSGKSVCMNTMLVSLLYQNAPHELKLILIDPKRVELSLYDGIPHLLTPVIHDAEKALKALRWAVAEMGRRLAKFSEQGARNLHEFNEKQKDDAEKLPRVVIVIDEFADLMMRQFRRDTEIMITRVAQIARATGMHLIIATQRPSVDVITGVIKANVPTRISFRTVSSIDARTILDMVGAEDLLGQGDMLYMTASTPMPIRIQGIYVSSAEVERVINQVKIAGGGALTEEIALGTEEKEDAEGESKEGIEGIEGQERGSGFARAGTEITFEGDSGMSGGINLDADDDGGDDLTFEAIELVRRTGKASASLLQRHLKIGYARAARLLDILEEKGVVGPVDGAKPRKVYMEGVL